MDRFRQVTFGELHREIAARDVRLEFLHHAAAELLAELDLDTRTDPVPLADRKAQLRALLPVLAPRPGRSIGRFR